MVHSEYGILEAVNWNKVAGGIISSFLQLFHAGHESMRR